MIIKKEDITDLFKGDRDTKLFLYKEGQGKASSSTLNKKCLFYVRGRKLGRYWDFYINKYVYGRHGQADFFIERFSMGEFVKELNRVINYSHIKKRIFQWYFED